MKTLGSKLVTASLFGILFLILLANSLHGSYPDEFDNILGGKLILQGILPYKGFFSHHGPLAYFLASPLVLLAGQSFVKFRILTSVLFLGYFAGLFYIFTQIFKKFDRLTFWFFAFLTSLAALYFWGHMLLADPISGLLLVPAYLILIYKMYFSERITFKQAALVGGFTFLSLINSMTYMYAGLIVYAVLTIYYLKPIILPVSLRNIKEKAKPVLIFGLALIMPYVVFGLYLLITGSIPDFLNDAVGYNQKYYIYNYPRPAGVETINPIRYAVVIFNNFFNNFHLAASGILSFNPRFPMTHALALANIVLVAWLVFKRKFLATLLVVGLLAFVNARGNPAEIKVTDYQTSVYFILGILNFCLVFDFLRHELSEVKENFPRIAFSILGLVLAVYWFFASMFIFSENWRTIYERFMGFAPLIYDRPIAAPIVNAVIKPNEYCWVGPFEFEEMFYLNCKQPSKYHWILPQFGGIPEVKKAIVSDFTKNSPKIIVFRRDYSAFGQSAVFNGFFVDFLNARYERFSDLPKEERYHFKHATDGDFNLDEDFSFRKDVRKQLVQELLEKGFLEKR